jgi:hypothetical protein
MFLISISIFIVIKKLINKDLIIGFLTLAMLYHPVGDTMVFYFSNFLFFVGLLMFYNKKKFWQIPIILACINHPFTILPSLYFILKDKKLLAVFSTIIVYFAVLTFLFSQDSNYPAYLPLVFLSRFLILITPILLIEDVFKSFYDALYSIHNTVEESIKNKQVRKLSKRILKDSEKKISFIKKLLTYKINTFTVLIIILITIVLTSSTIFSFYFEGYDYSIYSYNSTNEFFQNFPNISGRVRVVDYLWLPSLLYTNENITYTEGSFRENNNVNFEVNHWLVEDYWFFMNESTINYVLICKQCNPPTNEGEILEEYYPLVWENDYYILYNVTG